MSLKSKARLLIAGALAVTGLNIPIIAGAMKIKPLKPLKPLKPSLAQRHDPPPDIRSPR